MKQIAYLALAAALLPVVIFAQQPDARPQATGETVQINLVEIPVNVFDKNGNAIRGLKPENFEVYDDGKQRKITHFEEIDLATITTGSIENFNPAARRNFMLIFDLSNSSQRGLDRARSAAREFVSSALKPRDLASVATFTVEGGVEIFTSFTTDRALLDEAARNVGNVRFIQNRDPLLLASSRDLGLAQDATFEDPRGFEFEERQLDRVVELQLRGVDDRYARARVEKQLRTFGELARMLDRVRGKKQVIFLSEGFDSRLIQGREQSALTHEESLELFRGEIWKVDSDDRFGSTFTINELNGMTRLFRRSDVVLHAIDIKGLRPPSDARAGSQRREITNESLFLLVEGTGGDLLKNSNDLEASFARMLKQQEVIYILGFQTQPTGSPGKFHDLKVKVKVVGYGGLRPSHRAGYYEPQLQMSAVEQILSATDILMNDIPFEEVKANLLVTPFPQKAGNAVVPVIVEIDGGSLLERVSGNALHGEIFIYAFDPQNSVKDYLFQTVSLDLTQIREPLRKTGLKYYGTLSLPPGEFTIKTLIRVVESGMNGFQRVRVRVPHHGDPAILPPLFEEKPGEWIMLRGASKAEGEIDYPFVIGDQSFIPAARPTLGREGRHRFAIFTYNVPIDQLRLSAIVRDASGTARNARLHLVGRTEQEGDGSMKLLLELDPVDISPGDYSFDLTIHKIRDQSSETLSIPLRIETSGP